MGEPLSVSVDATDPVLEAGVTSTLRCCPGITVVPADQAADATVLVLDVLDDTALERVRDIRRTGRRPEVVLMLPEIGPTEVVDALAAGANGLLRRREADPDRLARTVVAAAQGDCLVPQDLLARLADGDQDTSGRGPADGWLAAAISEREQAVLRLVADGFETGEIAKRLCYSPRTVTNVVHDITHRFRLHNRAHAVAYALRAGML